MQNSALQHGGSSPDRDQIDFGDGTDVARRCREWGCTRVQLLIAAQGANSVMADSVECYLRAQGWHK
jgi:hypothetical protein